MASKSEEKTVAELLADFITSQKYEDLPSEITEHVKHHIIDIIGCIAGASQETQAQLLLDFIKSEGGNPHSSVFGCGFKTSCTYAALANGTMGHIFDFNDAHREASAQPTVVVAPAAFALGEKIGTSGKEFLRALILGSEVMIRVSESFLGKLYYQGFHPTAICGDFGAATACAVILGLNAKQTTYALGLAGSFAAGLLEFLAEGAWQKPLQTGRPAMCGIISGELAQKDFIGARTIFEGSDGFFQAFSHQGIYDYSRITDTLGQKWEMNLTSIKVHACCRHGAGVTDCALELYRQGVRAKDVDKIVAKVNDWTIKVLCTPPEPKMRPVTHVDAQFSLPYTIAVALVKQRTGVDEYREEVLGDPEVLTLMDKISWELDPEAEKLFPKASPVTVIATLKDGRTIRTNVDFPKGDPENPATLDEIVNKFHLLTEKIYDKDRRSRIVDQILKIDRLDNISKMGDLLR
jgi:2-methylcitrate dehydratase PrpD